jgi:hypothetical protein
MEPELKTFKDLTIPKRELCLVSPLCLRAVEKIIEDIRIEAIKHYKAIKDGCCPQYEHYLGEVYGLLDWIKDFFNITEEELK